MSPPPPPQTALQHAVCAFCTWQQKAEIWHCAAVLNMAGHLLLLLWIARSCGPCERAHGILAGGMEFFPCFAGKRDFGQAPAKEEREHTIHVMHRAGSHLLHVQALRHCC